MKILVYFFVLILISFYLLKQITTPKSTGKIFRQVTGFKVTAYCPCAKCNTAQWAGLISNGQKMDYYFNKGINIVAVDNLIIPKGSIIRYMGKEWIALDTGVKGKHIDFLVPTHKDTFKFGVKYNQTVEVKEEAVR